MTIKEIAGPKEPVKPKTEVQINVRFTDASRNPRHSCLVEWGDGTTTNTDVVSDETSTEGTCTLAHTYAAAGKFSDAMTVINDNGDSTSGTATVTVTAPESTPSTSTHPTSPTSSTAPTTATGPSRTTTEPTTNVPPTTSRNASRSPGPRVSANPNSGSGDTEGRFGLPVTGSATALAVAVGMLLIATGLVLYVVARRRRTDRGSVHRTG